MATVLIDKLLQAAVKQGASDIHIVVGQPPVFRLHGSMRKLETKVLEPDDTVALMKSIAPDRCQRELQESGSSDFGLPLVSWPAFASRFSNNAATSRWCCGRSRTTS
jgi:twitching motility protein PilT